MKVAEYLKRSELLSKTKVQLIELLSIHFQIKNGLSRLKSDDLIVLYLKNVKKKSAIGTSKVPVKSSLTSKSEIVRSIIQQLDKTGLKYTSGTVMKILEEQHGLLIHRSFCCTIIDRYKKTKVD